MGNRNVRVEERFEVSLGGVQIAAIVVAALTSLVIVFFLGLHTGERLGARRAEASRPSGLPELEAVAPAQRPLAPGELTYAAELPRAKPPIAAPPAAPKPRPAEPPPPSAAAEADTEPARPPPVATPALAAPAGGWTVQLGSAQTRGEAEELARKLQRLGPRIEEADIPGRGHWFRVRLGRFPDRASAEKYKADVARETGLSGVLVPPGG